MIDFSTLQGVTIPEGSVTQIESGGVVLWKTKPSNPIITFGAMPYDPRVYAEIGGVKYTGRGAYTEGYEYAGSGVTVEVPAGTVITCGVVGSKCDECGKTPGYGCIYLNGSQVASGTNSVKTYSYTVNGNITINASQTYTECDKCEEADKMDTSLYIVEG